MRVQGSNFLYKKKGYLYYLSMTRVPQAVFPVVPCSWRAIPAQYPERLCGRELPTAALHCTAGWRGTTAESAAAQSCPAVGADCSTVTSQNCSSLYRTRVISDVGMRLGQRFSWSLKVGAGSYPPASAAICHLDAVTQRFVQQRWTADWRLETCRGRT